MQGRGLDRDTRRGLWCIPTSCAGSRHRPRCVHRLRLRTRHRAHRRCSKYTIDDMRLLYENDAALSCASFTWEREIPTNGSSENMADRLRRCRRIFPIPNYCAPHDRYRLQGRGTGRRSAASSKMSASVRYSLSSVIPMPTDSLSARSMSARRLPAR